MWYLDNVAQRVNGKQWNTVTTSMLASWKMCSLQVMVAASCKEWNWFDAEIAQNGQMHFSDHI